jgi:hypothetical protein
VEAQPIEKLNEFVLLDISREARIVDRGKHLVKARVQIPKQSFIQGWLSFSVLQGILLIL